MGSKRLDDLLKYLEIMVRLPEKEQDQKKIKKLQEEIEKVFLNYYNIEI